MEELSVSEARKGGQKLQELLTTRMFLWMLEGKGDNTGSICALPVVTSWSDSDSVFN
jgi:hypothetical protein